VYSTVKVLDGARSRRKPASMMNLLVPLLVLSELLMLNSWLKLLVPIGMVKRLFMPIDQVISSGSFIYILQNREFLLKLL
jgi:hypothetical protein